VQLTEFSLKRPVTMVMATISVTILGIVSLTRLPIEQLPSVSSSGITASVRYDNASSEEIERKVVIPLEASLGAMSHIDRISSSSGRNSGSVRVDFKPGTDMDLAIMRMRERVDQARAFMPADVDRVRLRRWQSDQRPIIYANLAWGGDNDRLLDVITKVIEPRLLRLNGVANVVIDDFVAKQLFIELDREQLKSHGISLRELGWQLRENNVNVSLGRVMDGGRRLQVRLVSEFHEAEAIGDLPLIGGRFRLRDLGDVVYGYPDKTRYERLDGSDALELEIFKASTANVVDVGRAVVAELERLETQYAGKLDLAIVRNRADSVLREAGTLVSTAVLGGLLAMVIIFVFLRNIRSTLVVGMSIPTSALCVFIGMYAARELLDSPITLNMVTMMGLMLAVGMLVDPAVVVLESIFRHRQEEKLDPEQAALVGTREVGMAVLASSLTTTCVFVPFFFLTDSRAADWMCDAGLAICMAVIVSMMVSLTLLPLAASRLFRDGAARYDRFIKLTALSAIVGLVWYKVDAAGLDELTVWWGRWIGLIGNSITGMEWTTAVGFAVATITIASLLVHVTRNGLRSSYVRLLGWTLDHRWIVLAATVMLTATGYHLYDNIEHHGSPWQPERRIDVSVTIDRSYSLEEVEAHFTEIERRLLTRKAELDIETLTTRFGQRSGRIRAYLVDADEGQLTSAAASQAVQELLPEKVGYTYAVGRRRSWRGNTLGVEVELHGRDPAVLEVLLEDVALRLQQMPGVLDVDNSLEDGSEEIHVTVDRAQAHNYGLSPQDVASDIAAALGTRRTSGFKSDDREIDIVMQLNQGDRATFDQLRNSTFEGRDGTSIQLASVADFKVQQGPRNLRRADRQLNVIVFANTATQAQARELTAPVREMMASMDLPPGYSFDLGRASRWSEADAADTDFTTLLAILLIYLIMASLFESLVHPFIIMLAIPFSLIGVALGLGAFDVSFDNNGTLGLLILFGIVVNNGIVLIDHINHLRAAGLSRREAVLLGGQHRLRPILMTACTTILNLMPIVLPMVYGTAEGFSKRWGPTGLVVVSGLATSTLLTLVLAPTLYCLLDDLALWVRQVLRVSYSRAVHRG
jgi:HAE1 family hydrophobic/amphiphilic exporter-1